MNQNKRPSLSKIIHRQLGCLPITDKILRLPSSSGVYIFEKDKRLVPLLIPSAPQKVLNHFVPFFTDLSVIKGDIHVPASDMMPGKMG
jgi:hypothetical protein